MQKRFYTDCIVGSGRILAAAAIMSFGFSEAKAISYFTSVSSAENAKFSKCAWVSVSGKNKVSLSGKPQRRDSLWIDAGKFEFSVDVPSLEVKALLLHSMSTALFTKCKVATGNLNVGRMSVLKADSSEFNLSGVLYIGGCPPKRVQHSIELVNSQILCAGNIINSQPKAEYVNSILLKGGSAIRAKGNLFIDLESLVMTFEAADGKMPVVSVKDATCPDLTLEVSLKGAALKKGTYPIFEINGANKSKTPPTLKINSQTVKLGQKISDASQTLRIEQISSGGAKGGYALVVE